MSNHRKLTRTQAHLKVLGIPYEAYVYRETALSVLRFVSHAVLLVALLVAAYSLTHLKVSDRALSGMAAALEVAVLYAAAFAVHFYREQLDQLTGKEDPKYFVPAVYQDAKGTDGKPIKVLVTPSEYRYPETRDEERRVYRGQRLSTRGRTQPHTSLSVTSPLNDAYVLDDDLDLDLEDTIEYEPYEDTLEPVNRTRAALQQPAARITAPRGSIMADAPLGPIPPYGHCPVPDFPRTPADYAVLTDLWWDRNEMAGRPPTVQEARKVLGKSTDYAARALREWKTAMDAVTAWETAHYELDGFIPADRGELDVWLKEHAVYCYCS